MTTSDERRATGREIQGQLWPAILKGPGDRVRVPEGTFDHRGAVRDGLGMAG